MVDTQKVGAFIAQCRKEHNWTQKELGEKLGVTDKAVSKWENGRSFPDITLLESLCETFDITVSELLSGKKIESEDYKRETERHFPPSWCPCLCHNSLCDQKFAI